MTTIAPVPMPAQASRLSGDDGGYTGKSDIDKQIARWKSESIASVELDYTKNKLFGGTKTKTTEFNVRLNDVAKLGVTSLEDAKAAAQNFIGNAPEGAPYEAAVLQGVDGNYYLGRSDLTELYYRPPGGNGSGVRWKGGWFRDTVRPAIGASEFQGKPVVSGRLTTSTPDVRAWAVLGDGRPTWTNRPADA